jgi:hypothetical protein
VEAGALFGKGRLAARAVVDLALTPGGRRIVSYSTARSRWRPVSAILVRSGVPEGGGRKGWAAALTEAPQGGRLSLALGLPLLDLELKGLAGGP